MGVVLVAKSKLNSGDGGQTSILFLSACFVDDGRPVRAILMQTEPATGANLGCQPIIDNAPYGK